MRPAGEIRKALLAAASTAPGSTLQELASRASVGVEAARRTVDNLRRCGAIVRGPDKVVAYRNRPVATWMPPSSVSAQAANDSSIHQLAAALRAWG